MFKLSDMIFLDHVYDCLSLLFDDCKVILNVLMKNICSH